MSRPFTASTTCLSAGAGSAPGWENTRMPSRNAMSVGIDVMLAAAARPRSASVSILPCTTSGFSSEDASKTGANILHGPHQSAQKSTRTMSFSLIVCSNVDSVSVCVAMDVPPGAWGSAT
ncbi:Uncharacterised protein [Mycobacteroides abscessus]|nr:Uncharacterised protein [Mycobacteroides abscessus]